MYLICKFLKGLYCYFFMFFKTRNFLIKDDVILNVFTYSIY